MILIAVHDSHATCLQAESLRVGMEPPVIGFRFSPEWEGLTPLAVFTDGAVERTILNPGTEERVPWEVLQVLHRRVRVGIQGLAPDGTVAIPILWATLGVVQRSGSSGTASGTVPPTPELWQEALTTAQQALNKAEAVEEQLNNTDFSGIPGEKGEKGDPGSTISLSRHEVGNVSGVMITTYTTKDGNTTTDSEIVYDGTDGIPGQVFVPTVTQNGSSVEIAFKATAGTLPVKDCSYTIDLPEGVKGDKGEPGEAGADGHTPVKGTDYFTEADKQELVNEVLAALPDAEGVSF